MRFALGARRPETRLLQKWKLNSMKSLAGSAIYMQLINRCWYNVRCVAEQLTGQAVDFLGRLYFLGIRDSKC